MKPVLSAIVISICGLFLISSNAFALTVYMAGDSTMAIKDPKDYPETGWGVPFATFFNEKVVVANYAKNGRSTRTFIEEGLWKAITDKLTKGDIVFIQFGHNDASSHKQDRYTPPADYKKNLQGFIGDVRKKNAEPILFTPVIRRHFDEHGKLVGVHEYSKIVREIAAEDKSLLMIDMEKITFDYFSDLGDKDSAVRFMHIKPNFHPNYPFGLKDDTHFNELGAREVAQLLLSELKARKHSLAKMLRSVDPKHLKVKYE